MSACGGCACCESLAEVQASSSQLGCQLCCSCCSLGQERLPQPSSVVRHDMMVERARTVGLLVAEAQSWTAAEAVADELVEIMAA